MVLKATVIVAMPGGNLMKVVCQNGKTWPIKDFYVVKVLLSCMIKEDGITGSDICGWKN